MIALPAQSPLKINMTRFLHLIILFLLLTGPIAAKAATDDFPVYPVIAKNVAFWEKIYSTYSINDAVIHDSADLSKIYEVLPLLNEDLPGAKRINSDARKAARNKYEALLRKLSSQAPVSREEIRIAAMFGGKNSRKEMALAADRVRIQTGQRERFLTGFIQSGEYLRDIKRIFRSYRLPEELAYLPHVESSFNIRAYSKFGAAGMWQFTRSTGKQYLTIDYALDERLDPIAATHAAAKYLKNSFRILGDWPLALTSYNYGLAGMNRAVEELGGYEKIFTHYNKGHFKFASKNFYSEFIAALNVAKRMEKSGSIKPAPPLSCVYFRLPGYISITALCKHFGISVKTVSQLNPALRQPVFNDEKYLPKDYFVRLPANKKTNALMASLPSSLLKNEQKASLFHRVQKGDTAGSIARQHGVSLKSLMKANNLDKYATIYIQQKLRIPKATSGQSGDSAAVTIKARSKIVQTGEAGKMTVPTLLANKKLRPTEAGVDFIPKKDPTVYNVFSLHKKDGAQHGYITVQPEESLGLFATWLGTPLSRILSLNNLAPEGSVIPGQQLLLVFEAVSPQIFEEKRLDFLKETEDDFFSAYTVIGQTIYLVDAGDTLWDLCYNKFEIPLWLLERYNSAINLTRLTAKQELIIPLIQAM